MYIRSVTAEAFGPLTSETLELSPGLTVVHGDNETAKSSWHAAIYAALCGRRRGKGQPQLADREFALRRRPWDGDAWRVSCELVLDDGRSVSLRHDLDGKVDCRAVDDRGRDLSNEIMYDGAPDGSRWLGLNRRAFAATACINQAEMLRVLRSADELQADIQRAAATAGKDETAAAALDALKKYSSEHVGKDHANSKRPLRRALAELDRARAAVVDAQRAHDDYLQLVVDAQAASDAAEQATVELAAAEIGEAVATRLVEATEMLGVARSAAAQTQTLAAERTARAATSRWQYDRAVDLCQSLPTTPPTSGSDDDAVAQRVSRALGAWQSAPRAPKASGPSTEELKAQFDALPAQPSGDTVVDSTAERLRQDYLQARAVVDRDERNCVEPPDLSDLRLVAAVAAGAATVRSLAERLDDVDVVSDPQLEAILSSAAAQRGAAAAAVREAEDNEAATLGLPTPADALATPGDAAAAPAQGSRHVSPLTVAGVGMLAAALVLVVLGQPVTGGLAAIAGLAAVTGGFLRRSMGRRPASSGFSTGGTNAGLQAAHAEVTRARAMSLRAEHAYLEAVARRDTAWRAQAAADTRRRAAVEEAARIGLPPEAAQLHLLADQAERTARRQRDFEAWRCDYDADQQALQVGAQRLRSALGDRGYANDGDVVATYAAYARDCMQRAQQALEADRRHELQLRLDDRFARDEAAERANQTRQAAVDELVSAAREIEVATDDDAALGDHVARIPGGGHPVDEPTAQVLAEQMSAWLQRRSASRAVADRQRREWQELQTILAGRSIEDFDAVTRNELTAAESAQQAAERADAEVTACEQWLRAAAAEAGAPVPANVQSAASVLVGSKESLHLARIRAGQLNTEAARRRGEVGERERSIASVAEAEEGFQRARRELERVTSLDNVLRLTTRHLQQAQDKTYNDLAPVLNSALETWLPHVTGGRYQRARVDPETLAVTVESALGTLRPAELLSVGTAEQVYLLLRVALAEHLADKSTVSPLLLDDVTVQADPARTRAILTMCKELAEHGRQVVLFAQEPAVATWAEENLTTEQHSLLRLTLPAAA